MCSIKLVFLAFGGCVVQRASDVNGAGFLALCAIPEFLEPAHT